MELKQFIKEALLNIVDGVKEANEEKARFKIIGVKHNDSNTEGAYADFNVSVIVSETSSAEGTGKGYASFLKVLSVDLGGKTDQTSSQQNTHRLSFKIFITEK